MPQAEVVGDPGSRRRVRRFAPLVALVLLAVAVLTTAAVLGGTEYNRLIHPSTVATTPAVRSSQVPTPVVSVAPVSTPTTPSGPQDKGGHGPGHGKKKHHG
jgi:hypothetical protein